MVVSISANLQKGGHGNDIIWDPNIPQNWKNDNNTEYSGLFWQGKGNGIIQVTIFSIIRTHPGRHLCPSMFPKYGVTK